MIVEMNKVEMKTLMDKWKLKTIFYSWNDSHSENSAISNLLLTEYYPNVVDKKFCMLAEKLPFHFGNFYNFTCHNNIDELISPKSLSKRTILSQLNTKDSAGEEFIIPSTKCSVSDDKIQLISICSPCLISESGKILVDGYRPKRIDCDNVHEDFSYDPNQYKMYNEVFVLAQQWGFSYFHKMVENVPKIALYLDFLKRNTQIKIAFADSHVKNGEILQTLGLDSSRGIFGKFAAKMAYVPKNTECTSANFLDVQMLNTVYREYTKKVLNKGKIIKKNKILLVHRSGVRKLIENSKLVQSLRKIATKFNLELEVFKDIPLLSLNNTMLLFGRAVAVVAPHGAGLANLLYSSPHTIVIEGLLKTRVIACFQRLSYALGMRYYGMTSLIDSIEKVSLDPKTVAYTLDSILGKINISTKN